MGIDAPLGLGQIPLTNLQPLYISATLFAHINIAVCIEEDVGIRPLRFDTDAVPAAFLATPRKLHKKLVVRGDESFVTNAATGRKPAPVYLILDVPDIKQLFPAILRIVDSRTWQGATP